MDNMRICVNCGNGFVPNSAKQVTCSRRCNVAKWRKLNPEKNIASSRRNNEKRKGINRYSPETRKIWYSNKKNDIDWMNNIYKNDRKRYSELQLFINEYKSQHGCTDCGYNEHPAALHFHHINKDKELNVCNAKSIQRAKKEIDKCIVLCANCHAIRTYEEIQRAKID